jgi:nucleotide-binding universal stress UspA family protein
MFRRIVVPVDLSSKSLRAVRAAARVASDGRAEIALLHVIERLSDDDSGALRPFYRKLESAARERMKKLLVPFAGRRLSVRAEVLYGKPAVEILRFAQVHRADLIVMSSHRLAMRRSAQNWGTISYKVGILSRCPVLLVK